MCFTCHPLNHYETVHDHAALTHLQKKAFDYIDRGALELSYTNSDNSDYEEMHFTCTSCDRTFVLWLHHRYLSNGGEWRSLSKGDKDCLCHTLVPQ